MGRKKRHSLAKKMDAVGRMFQEATGPSRPPETDDDGTKRGLSGKRRRNSSDLRTAVVIHTEVGERGARRNTRAKGGSGRGMHETNRRRIRRRI